MRVSPLLLVAKAVDDGDRAAPDGQLDLVGGDERDRRQGVRQPRHRRGHRARPDRAEHQGRRPADAARAGRRDDRPGADGEVGQDAAGRHGGGTFTITNVGVFGVDTGTPILPPGESAILAFGAIRDTPWVHKGKIKMRQVTTLGLSFDHRIIDGELGSKFLRDIGDFLTDPEAALLAWG